MTNAFTIRPARPDDASAIARVQVESWNATYQTMLPAALLETMTEDSRTPAWERIITALYEAGTGIVFVVEQGGQVTGFASMGPQRGESLRAAGYTAEVTAIYLIEAAQGCGAGTALMECCADASVARGHSGLSVWVLSDNAHARAFYQKLGGVLFDAGQAPDRGGHIDEVAYVWPALDTLTGTRAR